MSLIIIDGHNAAFGLRLKGTGEKGKRAALLEHIQRTRAGGNDTIWVVFDSKGNPESHGYWMDRELYSVKVLFAPGSFDDWVIDQAVQDAFDSDTVVVTNDWDLRLKLSGRVICRGLDDYFGKASRRR